MQALPHLHAQRVNRFMISTGICVYDRQNNNKRNRGECGTKSGTNTHSPLTRIRLCPSPAVLNLRFIFLLTTQRRISILCIFSQYPETWPSYYACWLGLRGKSIPALREWENPQPCVRNRHGKYLCVSPPLSWLIHFLFIYWFKKIVAFPHHILSEMPKGLKKKIYNLYLKNMAGGLRETHLPKGDDEVCIITFKYQRCWEALFMEQPWKWSTM